MKTVEELVARVRRESRNATTGSTTAGASIDDAEFVDMLQDSQELCQELISGVFSKLFEETTTVTVTAGTEEYDLPSDLLLGTRVSSVEYTESQASEYYNLIHVDIRERETSSNTRVYSYARSGGKIILMQQPSSNGLMRIVYEKEVLRLDVSKITVVTAGRSGTDLDLTWTASLAHDDVDSWDVGDTVNILDRSDNSMLVKNGEISALNTGAGTATIDLTNATYDATTVDAAIDTNLRVIEGGRTNVSELPNHCEKFLAAYAVLLAFERDGSKLAAGAQRRFERISGSLLKSYLQEGRDFPAIPATDY